MHVLIHDRRLFSVSRKLLKIEEIEFSLPTKRKLLIIFSLDLSSKDEIISCSEHLYFLIAFDLLKVNDPGRHIVAGGVSHYS